MSSSFAMASSSWLLSMTRGRSGGTRGRSDLFIVNEQRVLSYPCITIGVHVVQGCAQMRLNFASARTQCSHVTDWLRSGIFCMRNFLYEMVLSNNRAADNDVNAAVDDVRVQAIECLIQTCNFIKES